MNCPQCSQPLNPTTTGSHDNGRTVAHRRYCPGCKKFYHTEERLVPTNPVVCEMSLLQALTVALLCLETNVPPGRSPRLTEWQREAMAAIETIRRARCELLRLAGCIEAAAEYGLEQAEAESLLRLALAFGYGPAEVGSMARQKRGRRRLGEL